MAERDTARGVLGGSEQRYRAFVTASSDIVYRMSPDWREMRQLDGQGVLADTVEASEGWRERYIHPDDLPVVESAIAAAIAGKRLFELEHRVMRADGTLGWVLSRAVPILDARGRIAEWLGAGRDITERKRDEVALRESGERRLFLLALSDALRSLRDADEIERVACRLLAEHLGVDRAYYVEIDEAAGTARVRRDFVRGGVPSLSGVHRIANFGWSVAILRRGGCHVVRDTRTSELVPVADRPASAALGIIACMGAPLIKDGWLVGALCVAAARPRDWSDGEVELLRDVGERIWSSVERARAETALRDSEARHRAELERQVAERTAELERSRDLLRATMDAFTDMIQVFGAVRDAAGAIVDFRWLLNNRTSEAQFGEVRGESLLQRNPDVVPEGVFDDFRRVVETGEPVQAERHYAHEQFDGWFLQSVVKLGDGVATTTKDITEWKRAQAETAKLREEASDALIREGEDRFRGLVEGFAQAVWETDADGRVVDESSSWLALTGQTPGRSAKLGWLDAVHPDDRGEVERRWREAVAAGRVLDVEYRLHDTRRGWRWTNARAVPLFDGEGRITKWVGINIDVSDRREAEELLRESEARFRQFAESSSDLIWIRNADTLRYEYINPAVEAIYGVAPADFSARHNDVQAWAEFLRPDDRAGALNTFRQVRAGERVTHEFRILRPDGDERWIRNTDFPLLDARGRVQRIGGIGEDVTDLKHAQAAIIESETRLRTLMEGIPQLVWRSCDRGRWTWASPQWLSFTGQTQEGTHGWGWLDAIHPDDRSATMAAWEAARPHGMLDVEYRVLRARDGAWIWHHTRSVPVRDADGRIVEWLGTSTDIQGLRELQERQDVLVAELQHRTRNLIGVVRSMADKSLGASADLRDFSDRFGHRMQALSRVQGLLSRLSEGERVTFDALLATELSAVDAIGDARVALDGPDDVALRSGSVQTLALAIHELATNAVKYGALGHPGGRLRIAWRMLPPSGSPEPRLHIEWRETGVPMPRPGSPPRGSGQGRELIERALPYQLDAETTYVFGADGIRCSIIVPVSSHTGPRSAAHG